MNQDELIEKCRLTGEEMADLVRQAQTNDYTFMVGLMRIAEAQLRKAIPIIEAEARKAERERWLRELEAIDQDSYDVKDFTRRVCDLIVEEKQMLK